MQHSGDTFHHVPWKLLSYKPPLNERKKIAQTLLLGHMTQLFSVCTCFANAKVKVIRAL